MILKDRTLPLYYLRNFFGLREVYLPGARDRHRVLSLLAEAAARCRRCPLAQSRQKSVFGWGNPYARLMLVGEAPGRHENRTGKPFVGNAGAMLTALLSEIGVDRERDVYITNVVKCRPPQNRDPAEREISACLRFLKLQVETISPDLIFCLGRHSARTLLGIPYEDKSRNLGSLRGRIHRSIFGPPVVVTYHPSYVVQHPKDAKIQGAAKRDFRLVAEFMGWARKN